MELAKPGTTFKGLYLGATRSVIALGSSVLALSVYIYIYDICMIYVYTYIYI